MSDLLDELQRLSSTLATATTERDKARKQLDYYRRMVEAAACAATDAERQTEVAAEHLRAFVDLHHPRPATAAPALAAFDPRAITVREAQ